VPAVEAAALPAPQLAPVAWDRDITFFVACYNEEENITDTLNTLTAALAEFDWTWEIIVVDDGSTDRSAEVVRRYIQEHPGLPIYCHAQKQNRGLARCYIDAAFLGKGKYYRLVCGDNVEPKETFVTILRHLGEADMIIPYQVETKGKALSRRILSRAYTWLVNAITGRRIRYYNGLAVHLRYNVMRWHPDTRGFGFQAELIARLLDEGFSYVEVPVKAQERTKGRAKAITLKNICSVAHTLLELVIRRLSRKLYGRTGSRAAATRPAAEGPPGPRPA
jgi:glycosyltransferase involved in cell wall biosynthesis